MHFVRVECGNEPELPGEDLISHPLSAEARVLSRRNEGFKAL